MSIDTREKRASAINVSLPFRGILPLADSTIGQADRQQTAFMYSGILADAAVPPTPADPTLTGTLKQSWWVRAHLNRRF